jgi:glycosyltransferase involved in cell wall biosynthesis
MAEPVRVLSIIGRLNIGGPAMHAILLTHGLRGRGYETVLVAGQEGPREGSLRDLAAQKAVEPLFLPELGREIRVGRDLLALFSLVRILTRQRPAIVHTHTAKAGALGRIAARLAGVPVVVHTFHGHVLHGYFSRGTTRVFLEIERRLAGITTRILTVSETQRQELLDLKIATPRTSSVMPLGLELDPFLTAHVSKGTIRRQLGLSPHVPLVGIVGRLVPIKDHATFLEAAAALHRSRPEVRFLVVGDGELRPSLERLAGTLDLDGRVHFLGWQRDMPRVYADLDLLVLSSINEGTPVALIEAMAAGLPVVATRVGGVADVVDDGKTGLLVPPKDPAALNRAMAVLLDDPDRRREMGQAGRHAVYPLYSDDALLDRMDALYAALLRTHGRPA